MMLDMRKIPTLFRGIRGYLLTGALVGTLSLTIAFGGNFYFNSHPQSR